MAGSHLNDPGDDRITLITRYGLRIAFATTVALTAVDPATALQQSVLADGIGRGLHAHPLELWWLWQGVFIAVLTVAIAAASGAGRALAARTSRPGIAFTVDVAIALAALASADTGDSAPLHRALVLFALSVAIAGLEHLRSR